MYKHLDNLLRNFRTAVDEIDRDIEKLQQRKATIVCNFADSTRTVLETLKDGEEING